MTDEDRARQFYRSLLFDLLVNIKAVNSGVYKRYICDMNKQQYFNWQEFVETLKEAGWIP